MVRILKPYSRVTVSDFAHYEKPIVITLLPGDVISMRLLRTRKAFVAPLADVYRTIVGWHIEADRQRKRQKRRGA